MEPEALVRAIYDAWNAGKRPDELIAEDIEYVNPPDAVEGGVKRGRDTFNRLREIYDQVVVTPERFVRCADDEVVVISRLTGIARVSGAPVDTIQGYIWQVRDGKAVEVRAAPLGAADGGG